jgi:hypothetical protein
MNKIHVVLMMLFLIIPSTASENLTWLEGKTVTYLQPRTNSMAANDFNVCDGTVDFVYNNFVYIKEIDTWIQSNWIWSVSEPKIAGVL